MKKQKNFYNSCPGIFGILGIAYTGQIHNRNEQL